MSFVFRNLGGDYITECGIDSQTPYTLQNLRDIVSTCTGWRPENIAIFLEGGRLISDADIPKTEETIELLAIWYKGYCIDCNPASNCTETSHRCELCGDPMNCTPSSTERRVRHLASRKRDDITSARHLYGHSVCIHTVFYDTQVDMPGVLRKAIQDGDIKLIYLLVRNTRTSIRNADLEFALDRAKQDGKRSLAHKIYDLLEHVKWLANHPTKLDWMSSTNSRQPLWDYLDETIKSMVEESASCTLCR